VRVGRSGLTVTGEDPGSSTRSQGGGAGAARDTQLSLGSPPPWCLGSPIRAIERKTQGYDPQNDWHAFWRRFCVTNDSHTRKAHFAPIHEWKITIGFWGNDKIRVPKNGRMAFATFRGRLHRLFPRARDTLPARWRPADLSPGHVFDPRSSSQGAPAVIPGAQGDSGSLIGQRRHITHPTARVVRPVQIWEGGWMLPGSTGVLTVACRGLRLYMRHPPNACSLSLSLVYLGQYPHTRFHWLTVRSWCVLLVNCG
jgi:hypothetical protein